MNKFVRRKRKVRFIIFLCLCLGFFLILDFNLRPIVKCSAQNKAKVIACKAINEAVSEENQKKNDIFLDIIKVCYKENGDISSISSDMKKINELKAEVSLAIQKKLSDLKKEQLNVPLGSLTGVEILSGRGMMVPIKIFTSGNVNVDFKSEFFSSGINQTVHKIFLEVSAVLTFIVPGCSNKADVKTNIPISETVIVGEIPKVYRDGMYADKGIA